MIKLPLVKGRKELIAVLILAVILTGLIAGVMLIRGNLLTPGHPDFSEPWDHHKYIHMATESPVGFHIAPFCRRIFVPALAKLLPFGLQCNFFLIAFVSICLTGVTVYYLAKKSTSSLVYGFIGMGEQVHPS